MSTTTAAAEAIESPDPRLLTYYCLAALVVPPLFPLVFLPLYFRYHTLRYRFDAEGISMRWGILFRREIVLNYARIQDIQLRANVVERWLGLARIELQTAAGNSGAEMTLEGFRNYEAVRDFLYERMRGVRQRDGRGGATTMMASGMAEPPSAATAGPDELAAALREVTAEVRALREDLERRGNGHV